MAKKSTQLTIEETNVETKKGENAMTTTFNVWEFTKQKVCEAYLNNLDKKEKDFEIKVKHINDLDFVNDKNEQVHIEGAGKVLGYLAKQGAFKYEIKEQIETVDDKLKTVYIVKIKEFNPKATAISKKNDEEKEFLLFKGAMGRAFESQVFYTKATA